MMKKVIAVGVICLLVMVTSPTVVGREIEINNKTIEPNNCYEFEIEVTWETYYDDGWFVQFVVTSNSTIERIEFFINDGHHETVTGSGPVYELSPLCWSRTMAKSTFAFVGYGVEGGTDTVIINGSEIKSYPTNYNDIPDWASGKLEGIFGQKILFITEECGTIEGYYKNKGSGRFLVELTPKSITVPWWSIKGYVIGSFMIGMFERIGWTGVKLVVGIIRHEEDGFYCKTFNTGGLFFYFDAEYIEE